MIVGSGKDGLPIILGTRIVAAGAAVYGKRGRAAQGEDDGGNSLADGPEKSRLIR